MPTTPDVGRAKEFSRMQHGNFVYAFEPGAHGTPINTKEHAVTGDYEVIKASKRMVRLKKA
jgi:hypothetical protein